MGSSHKSQPWASRRPVRPRDGEVEGRAYEPARGPGHGRDGEPLHERAQELPRRAQHGIFHSLTPIILKSGELYHRAPQFSSGISEECLLALGEEPVVHLEEAEPVREAVDYNRVPAAARIEPRERGAPEQLLRLLERSPEAEAEAYEPPARGLRLPAKIWCRYISLIPDSWASAALDMPACRTASAAAPAERRP